MSEDVVSARRAVALAITSQTVAREAQDVLASCELSNAYECGSVLLRAGNARDIADARRRLNESPEREGPRFVGFRELLPVLSELDYETRIRSSTVLCESGTVQIFSDVDTTQLYGVVYALIPNNLYWRKYVQDRASLAYQIGYQDGRRRARPKDAKDLSSMMNGTERS